MEREAQFLHSHQVDILYDFQPTPICTGVILSSYLILTVASCLADRKLLKLTVQTQPQLPSRSRNEEETEDEEPKGFQTRYVDRFDTINAEGPDGTFTSEHQLAIVTLDEELKWSANVNKARVIKNNAEEYSHIWQPYKCFYSQNTDAKLLLEPRVQKTVFPICMRDSSSSPIFPLDCISNTSSTTEHGHLCPAPLPGSGIFCQTTLAASFWNDDHNKLEEPTLAEERVNAPFLCGILSSDSDGPRPLYINVTHDSVGSFLIDEDEDEDKEEEEEDNGDDGDDSLKDDNYDDVPDLALDPNFHSLNLSATSVGGREVNFSVESFPYQLSLQYFFGGYNHKCGAVLLDERTALTAAHCFEVRTKPTNYRLVAGMKDRGEHDADVQVRQVSNAKLHDMWTPPNFSKGFDIALVFVKEPFVLKDKHVQPVWISSSDDPIVSDFNGTATGWGYLDNSTTLAKHLMTVDLAIRSHETCKEVLPFFTESMICSYNGESNTCTGDSGGPLVLRNYQFPDQKKRDLLIGISSFAASTCEDLTRPSGFTKVSYYYDWIMKYWKRNTSTTAPNKFKCLSGQEIEEDWRCDEEFDCVDGSDEKGCKIQDIEEKDVPKTRGCGGKIQLKTDEHDIIYLAHSSKPGKIVQCIWTIHNAKDNHIELTLLSNTDVHFDSDQSQLIALHNFTLQHQHFNYESITQIGQEINIAESYTALVFRGPAGIRDSGFHLRIKNVGRNTEQNPRSFKTADLHPTSTVQNHAYPQGQGPYGVNERIFAVLTPGERGGRIKLNFIFGGMEPDRDWFDVISIGKQPKSLFRFSKALGRNLKQAVEGGKDEIVLVVMNTGSPAVKRKGMQFTYSEDLTRRTPSQRLSCGGNLTVNGDQDLVYETDHFKSSCLWVISNSRAGSSRLTLLDSRSELFNLTDGSSSLYILHNFSRHDSFRHHINKFRRGYSVDQPFFVLYFRSSPFATTTGFFLQLKHLNSTSNSSSPVTQHAQPIILTPTLNQTQEFSYPVTRTQNSNSNSDSTQSAIILVQPTRDDRKVHLNLKKVHLADENEEWMEILTFRQRPISIYRTSGSRNITDQSLISSEGEPFVIYLKSKSELKSNRNSNKKKNKSFTFSYSEQEENGKHMRLEPCGGVINLGRRHKLTYISHRGQRSHCLWVVHNAHGPHSNITARFDTTNSQLDLIQDDEIVHITRNKVTKTDSSAVAILFRSNGKEKEFLTVNLKAVSDFESETGSAHGENSLDVKKIELEATSQGVKKFAYPPAPALSYGNNERVFILITPEASRSAGDGAGAANGSGNKIQLNLTFINIEPKFDRLELYTFRPSQANEIKRDEDDFDFDDGDGDADADFGANGNLQRVLEFSNFGFWTNNTFSGESDEPFLLYFQSDSSTVKSGFKFNYTSIR